MKYVHLEHENIESLNDKSLFNSIIYQTSSGKLVSKRHVFIMPQLSLLIRHETVATNTICRNDDEHYFFAFPFSEISIDGKVIAEKSLFAVAPSELFFCPLPENFTGIGLFFNKENAKKYLSAESLNVLDKGAEFIRNGSIIVEGVEQYCERLHELCTQFQHVHDELTEQDVECYCIEMFKGLDELFKPHSDTVNRKKMPVSTRKNIVSRAIEYLLANPTNNISIPQLADFCFCSVRSLEYAFKSMFQMTPKQFLNLRKLHLIREQLQAQEFSTFKELFDGFDITNHRRFVTQYAEFFGETPKETRAKFEAL